MIETSARLIRKLFLKLISVSTSFTDSDFFILSYCHLGLRLPESRLSADGSFFFT